MRARVAMVLVCASVFSAAGRAAPPARNAAETEAWRTQREKDLKSETGWLTVAGLVFLKPGANSVGSDPDSDVRLPAPAPARAGTVTRDAGAVVFEPTAGA